MGTQHPNRAAQYVYKGAHRQRMNLIAKRVSCACAHEFIFLLVQENEPKEGHPGLAPCEAKIRKVRAVSRPGRAYRPRLPSRTATQGNDKHAGHRALSMAVFTVQNKSHG